MTRYNFGMDSNQVAKYAFLAAALTLVIAVFANWRAHEWPKSSQIRAELRQEPEQKPTSAAPIYRREKRYTTIYEIKPRFTYKLRGLVVSTHDSTSWNDMSHAAWGDTLNSADLCVVWGDNVDAHLLDKISFSHGDWTCYFGTHDRGAFANFHANQFSNNHILPADAAVSRAVAATEVGDQIEVEGYLVDYSINGRSPRVTSITREDTGNGACEIIYATSLTRLARVNQFWFLIRRVGFILALSGFIFAFAFYFIWPFFRDADDSDPSA